MATLSLVTPKLHSMTRGDHEKVFTKQTKKGLTGKVHFFEEQYRPELKWLPFSNLIPLESQRETKTNWVLERQEARDGLDMFAFGALSVAQDPVDKKYYVWDGCGRWAIAESNTGITEVPCLVYPMSKAQAAYYFAYNQEEGRRRLSREVTFVNGVLGQDPEHLKWAERLDQIGCYIKANETAIINQGSKDSGYPEILTRALKDGFKLAGGDMSLQRQARDMIVSAWSITDQGCPKIVTEIYWALIKLMKTFPECRKNGLNRSLQQYLNALANFQSQGSAAKEWKGKEFKGLTGNVGVAGKLALALLKSFKGSSHWKGQYSNVLVEWKLDPEKSKSKKTDSVDNIEESIEEVDSDE